MRLLSFLFIGIAQDGGVYSAGERTLSRGNEEKKLHQVVVEVAIGKAEDKGALVANRLRDFDIDLPIQKYCDRARSGGGGIDWFGAARERLQLTARLQQRAPDGGCLAGE
ncbi:hypothetical protein H4582DRAFT_1983102 [Lactarius indigo]|nr:hypothetical protein H4582DRAFT_1983102 [Lactarius indigo]